MSSFRVLFVLALSATAPAQNPITTVAHLGSQFYAQMTTDAAGNVYASDTRQVFRVTPAGVVTLFAGSGNQLCTAGCPVPDNSPAVTANLMVIGGVAVDPSGSL